MIIDLSLLLLLLVVVVVSLLGVRPFNCVRVPTRVDAEEPKRINDNINNNDIDIKHNTHYY